MSHRSLEDLLGTVGSPVELLRNSQTGANVFPGVPPEFTNWRDEQRAWQTTCLLFDQSFHMNDLLVRGPDAVKLLSQLGVNSFEGFAFDRAKHFVPCTPDGYVIGDVILFPLADDEFNLVGRAPALNWVTYHAETGGYDVEVELDLRTALRTDGRRRSYRFQLQGPNAMQVTENALGQAAPDLRFFHTTTVDDRRQDGRRAASRHGRPAGLGALRAVGGSGGRAGGAADRRRGPRASCDPADGRTRPTPWSRAGFPRRSRPCTRARA